MAFWRQLGSAKPTNTRTKRTILTVCFLLKYRADASQCSVPPVRGVRIGGTLLAPHTLRKPYIPEEYKLDLRNVKYHEVGLTTTLNLRVRGVSILSNALQCRHALRVTNGRMGKALKECFRGGNVRHTAPPCVTRGTSKNAETAETLNARRMSSQCCLRRRAE
jgi:hypothetical protein